MTAQFETIYGAHRASAERYSQQSFLLILPETTAKYGIEARDYSYDLSEAAPIALDVT
jgi:hypothetical protein